MEYSTKNGKKYTLRLRDGDYFYRWYGDGELPKLLRGGFLDVAQAERAMKVYLSTVDAKKALRTPLTDLEKISKKKDLLEFADKHSISVPDDLKIPSQIKKHIQQELGDQNG